MAPRAWDARSQAGGEEAPPPETGNTDTLFAYPNAGQSEQQQADDRFECHDWASRQSGYDPSLTPAAGANREDLEQRPDYLRALSACLEGRNYTVR